MKLEMFFEKFDRFANAPDAVAKMRELVLHLAVHGNLVSQSSGDEPAKELLKRSRAEMTKRMAARQAKQEKPAEPVSDDEATFSLPTGWAWCRLVDAGQFINGLAFKPSDWGSVGRPIIRIQNLSGRNPDYNRTTGTFDSSVLVQDGDILVSWSATLDAFIWRGEEAVLNQHIFRVLPARLADKGFLYWLLKWVIRQLAESDHAHGLVMSHINRGPFLAHPIPLPPLAEQKRIVAKVDELMALCDRLEAQQRERETRHAALARASLARFSATPNPANLTFLFHKSYAIPPADLRKSILTLAAQGKLVPQDTNLELGEEFPIVPKKAEGNRAKWAGPIQEQEIPFQLPSSWRWLRLGDIASLKHGYAFSSKFFTSERTPFVLTTPGNFYEKGGFRDRESKRKYYSGPVDPEFIFKPGDLIIPMTEQAAGLLGSPAFIPDDGRVYIHNQRLGKFNFTESITPEFAFWFFNCEFFRGELARTSTGMKVRHTSPDRILRVPFPVCSLAEQRRVVAKLEQLIALVDELETHLAASRATAANLLSALVAELTGGRSNVTLKVAA